MWLQREPEKESKLFDVAILPGATYACCLMTWIWLIEPQSFKTPNASLIFLLGLVAFAYEIGLKNYLLNKKRKYFYLVFAIPVVGAIVGVTGSYIFGNA